MRVPPYFQRRLADPESLLLYTKGAKTLSETGSGFAAVVLIKNAFCFVSSLGWLRNCFKGDVYKRQLRKCIKISFSMQRAA